MTSQLPPKSATTEENKSLPLNMRVDVNKRDLIDVAAAISGSDRTSFILHAARRKAEEVILDQRLFVLPDGKFDAFERVLQSNPIKNNTCVQKLLNRPYRWG